MADDPRAIRSERMRRWRTRVTWASWVFGALVILIAGVVGIVLKDGDNLPHATVVALWAGCGLIGISILVRPGDASGHIDNADGGDDDDFDLDFGGD